MKKRKPEANDCFIFLVWSVLSMWQDDSFVGESDVKKTKHSALACPNQSYGIRSYISRVIIQHVLQHNPRESTHGSVEVSPSVGLNSCGCS